jgi:3-phosphoshikimate 1-carboxyvinyltransferase
LLVAGAIAGPVTIRGLDMMSTQADKAIMEALSRANASFAIEAKGIKIRPGKMKAFEFDATDCPDLFPPLVALASYCNGKTKMVGVNRLAHKESNRAVSLQQEFGTMGVQIETYDDIMLIHGDSVLTGAKVHSHHDHRIAMACAVAALRANGETVIEESEAVKKSYPDFFRDLKTLGAQINDQYSMFNVQ